MGRLKKEIVLYKMGIEYFKEGNLQGALDCFGKAVERNPRFSKGWIW